jgi:predicted RNase H-like HicB family nuclease/predicted RNA binding protein YcfA (HicA-like mRNA interferase family)
MKVRDVLKLLKEDGLYLVATEGSHRQYKHARKPGRVTVPGKLKEWFADRHAEQHNEAGWIEEIGEQRMRYAIVIERAESNFAAYVPDLPGCVATGKTVEETEEQIREAIEFHIRGMREDGLPIPAPSSQVDYVEIAA